MAKDENDGQKCGCVCEVRGRRNQGYDFLRAVGLFLIILAHANPPPIIANLRTFDVVLMVFISGITHSLQPGHVINWFVYLQKRVLRLLVPVWIFLTVFFLFMYVMFYLKGDLYPFSSDVIVDSYLLNHGIGYVWIIRVFLLVALAAPLLMRLSNYIRSDWVYSTVVLLIFCLYEAFQLTCRTNEFLSDNIVLKNFIFYLIPYSCVFSLGIRIRFMTARKILFLCFIFLLMLVGLSAVAGQSFMGLNEYKYPPRLFYLVYGVVISLFFYRLFVHIRLKGVASDLVAFSSKSSMWIYLWHILFLSLWQFFSPMWAEQFIVKFLLITFLSLLAVKIQLCIVTAIVDRLGWTGKKRYWVRVAFL